MIGTSLISPPLGWGAQKPPPGVGIDWSHPLSCGLVGCWLLNEGSGTRTNDMTDMLSGTIAAGTWAGSGKGQSLLLNGSSSFVTCSTKPRLDLVDAISVELLLKPTNLSTAPIFISKRQTSPNVGYCWEISTTTGSVLWRVNTNAYYVAGGTLSDNNWYHIICTYNRSRLKIYVNDRIVANASLGTDAINVFPTVPVVLGKRLHAGAEGYTSGNYLLARIYNRALLASEVAYLYCQPYCMFESGEPTAFPGSGLLNIIQASEQLQEVA